MKLFAIKLILFFSIITLLIIAFGRKKIDNSVPQSDYMAAIIDKHSRLNSLASPRLIFCGESNLAFGLDSEEIENQIGLSTVNLGLHGGLGLEFILNEAKLNIRKGDIIILSTSYYLSKTEDYSLMMHTASIFPEAYNYFSSSFQNKIVYYIKGRFDFISNRYDVFKYNFNYLKKGKRARMKLIYKINPYSRAAFNKYGDGVGHLDDNGIHRLVDRKALTYHYYNEIFLLNEFYNYCQNKGVMTYFIFPPYPVSEYEINKNVIDNYYLDFKQNLKIPVISRPEDFVFSDSLFFDTIYHLNKKGREKRTNLIIDILKKMHIKNE